MPTTVDSITAWLSGKVKAGEPIGPEVWMDAALALNVLLQTEQEYLFELEQLVADKKSKQMEDGKTAAYAKVMTEASDIYKQARIQRAKIDRAQELIRLSKANARISRDMIAGQI